MQSKMKLFLLRTWSYLTNTEVNLGTSVSFDDQTMFSKPPSKEQKEKVFRESTSAYFLKDSNVVGGFELDGTGLKNSVKIVRLRHTLTGNIYTFPESLFEILFDNSPKKVPKHG